MASARRAGGPARPHAPRWPTSDAALRQLLHGLPGVDQVGAAQRAAALATRSIKRDAKLWALDAGGPRWST